MPIVYDTVLILVSKVLLIYCNTERAAQRPHTIIICNGFYISTLKISCAFWHICCKLRWYMNLKIDEKCTDWIFFYNFVLVYAFTNPSESHTCWELCWYMNFRINKKIQFVYFSIFYISTLKISCALWMNKVGNSQISHIELELI